MADPFATALGTLFRGPRAVAAVFQSGAGPAVPIRVVRIEPSEEMELNGSRIIVETTMLEIQRSDVAQTRRGDVVTIGAEQLVIQGEPKLDQHRLKWLCEAPPEA